jgi:hypothetical protein
MPLVFKKRYSQTPTDEFLCWLIGLSKYSYTIGIVF